MKHVKKRRTIIIGIVAAVFLLAVLAVLSIRIDTVTVSGNHKYTAEQMTELVFGGKWDRNVICCLYKDRFKEHEQIPFVEDYKIVFQGLTDAEIIVYEKSVVGYVSYMGSFLYFDKDGIVVESSNEKLEEVPWITGLKFGHIALHQPLPVENSRIFDGILTLTQLLTTHEITVECIEYDSHGNATLKMGEIDVYLGNDDDMSGKISELKDQLPVLGGLSGTLYLDTYHEAEPAASYRFIKNK